MRRSVASILTAALTLALAASAMAATRPVAISVKPHTGSPGSSFVVSFRAPDRTGLIGMLRREYLLTASSPSTAAGCATDISLRLPATKAGARVGVALGPKQLHAPRWCPGTFHGQIEEIQTLQCPPGELCPAFVAIVRHVGKFSFRVRTPGADTTAPSFAGLLRALACTPGPQRPGETTPYTLTWSPARDDRTPSSGLVYDIYTSTTSGGEDLLKPSWTSAPGATSFRTPGLPSHGAAFFVVRARDAAGNEDGNTVERAGVDPCL